ncbi:hypothetical protein [Cellulosimicrobium sp. CUA-896]|uniref:hypothetical protein n=1 Tax=Cellulosimicrobium sp. CUA-896 TaxID=1517881 RepID=UPI002101B919|nr:hypothetical protein [Cellulosimicrobium sp. CUA-896]
MLDETSPDGVEMWSTPAGSWAYLLNGVETSHTSVELWKWHITGSDTYRSAPADAPDSMVTVLQGVLRATSAVADLRVTEGASATLPSTSPVTFGTASDAVDFLWVVTVPRRPA